MLAFKILSPKTEPNMSAYRPDYLFQAVLGVKRNYPSKSLVSKDGLLIMAFGNGPVQDGTC